MIKEGSDRQVNTSVPAGNDGGTRLPHERDEAPDAHPPPPRSVIRQAASDLEQGLVDTDLHGTRGVETVQPKPPGKAQPQPGTKRD